MHVLVSKPSVMLLDPEPVQCQRGELKQLPMFLLLKSQQQRKERTLRVTSGDSLYLLKPEHRGNPPREGHPFTTLLARKVPLCSQKELEPSEAPGVPFGINKLEVTLFAVES